MQKITRRAALRGTAAVAAVVAVPAAGIAQQDARLRALEQQWHRQRHYACYEQSGKTDEEQQPAFDRLFDLEDLIIEAPARSSAGIAVKLRLYVHYEKPADEFCTGNWQFVATALHDAERLVREG